jgi:LemA protein
MKKIILFGIIAALALFIFSGINTLPRLDEKVKASWSQVENQYQRRSDLIPNLVATVKGYAAHEKSTLEGVIQARANATKVTITPETISDPEAFKKYEQAQGQLSSALSKLMMVSEQYPNLKADQQFLSLQSQLEGTENRITVARRDYIGVVQEFNTAVRTFPTLIWAKIQGMDVKPAFAATTPNADVAPKVEF